MIKGRVLQILSDRFVVDVGESDVYVKARKRLKRDSSVLPGDIAELDYAGGEYVLSRICERKSRLIRPPLANPDQFVITLAPVPEADLGTVDKMLINAHNAGINTVICVNKTDIMPLGFYEEIRSQYEGIADCVVSVSAANADIEALKEVLSGKFSCFAGQSAVGKTSLVNAICGVSREVGDLSEKTMRGKNTTTGVELIRIGKDTFVADTPGFGALDIMDVDAAQLHLCYSEYVAVSSECKYHMCTHISEPECAVRKAVEDGKLNGKRYERYCKLFDELKNRNSYMKTRRRPYENR